MFLISFIHVSSQVVFTILVIKIKTQGKPKYKQKTQWKKKQESFNSAVLQLLHGKQDQETPHYKLQVWNTDTLSCL